jgi:hypothetical protein
MHYRIFLATINGVVSVDVPGGPWHKMGRALSAHKVTTIDAHEGNLLAGTADGIFRSEDLGETWEPASEGLTVGHVRWVHFHPEGGGLAFAGTEPAAIFVSEDGGRHWEGRPEVTDLRDEYEWSLPYSPAAGAVRGFAFHGDRGYAAVEQGGLLRSDDRGRSWAVAPGSEARPNRTPNPAYLHPDVHSVLVHPSSPDTLFAATGGGLYRSFDGGESWDELYDCYCRAVWVDPLKPDPENVILGPADGVDREGRIERSLEAGKTWQSIAGPLDTPWPHKMVERFVQFDDQLITILSNGDLLVTALAEINWRREVKDVDGINDAAAVEV